MAITWPAKNNFATGDVLTATQMNNIGDDLNDLNTRVASAGGFFKNPILNSNFSVWQRGTSISLAASSPAYTADRWYVYLGASQASTVSRQATSDSTNLPNIQYCARFQRNSGQTGTGTMSLSQPFESINSVAFAGKTVTYSFYARAGANFSAASSNLTIYLATGTGTDQNQQGAGYTGQALPISSTATLTTTWQRFTYSATLGATITELQPIFSFTPTGTAGANDYFEVTGIQLEVGSSATTYYPNGNTYQAELAACQRYYYSMLSGNALAVGMGTLLTANAVTVYVSFPVTMRTTPTLSAASGTSYYVAESSGGGADLFNSFTIGRPQTNGAVIYNSSEIASTAGQASYVYTNNSLASISFNAEL